MQPALRLAVVAMGTLGGSAAFGAKQSPGNVLILMVDDMGFEMVGGYGVKTDAARTPTLDSMIEHGVLFRNAWSNPLCTPTRATIQTGRYGFRTGLGHVEWNDPVPLSLADLTIPEMLDQGTRDRYQHALFGKWHLGTRESTGGLLSPNVAGYDHYAGTLLNFEGDQTFFDFNKVVDGIESREQAYATTDQVDDAIQWISKAQEPWFCFVNFHAPHSPFHAPPDHLLSEATRKELSQAGPVDDDPRPYYKAMCEAVDTEIGRMRKELGPLWEEATVIFLSDNGTPDGAVTKAPVLPGKAKGSLYRGGVNIPLIVTGPHVRKPGSESQALVHTVDLFATIADIANVDLTAQREDTRKLDSLSFLPVIEDPSSSGQRQTLFSEKFFPNVRGGPSPQRRQDWSEDLGFAGPGSASLRLEGNMVRSPEQAQFVIEGAPANQTALLIRGPRQGASEGFGGTVVPTPVIDYQGFVTDSEGTLRFSVLRAGIEQTTFAQVAIKDPSMPGGWSLTNAVRVDFPEHTRAIRDKQYHLIHRSFGGGDSFFDIEADPWLERNLLEGSMSRAQRQRYHELMRQLEGAPPDDGTRPGNVDGEPDPPPALSIRTEPVVSLPGRLEVQLSGGAGNRPAAVVVTGVNDQPFFTCIAHSSLDSVGSDTLFFQAGAALDGFAVTFQAFGEMESGKIEATGETTVRFSGNAADISSGR